MALSDPTPRAVWKVWREPDFVLCLQTGRTPFGRPVVVEVIPREACAAAFLQFGFCDQAGRTLCLHAGSGR